MKYTLDKFTRLLFILSVYAGGSFASAFGDAARIELTVNLPQNLDTPYYMEQLVGMDQTARNISSNGNFQQDFHCIKWGPLYTMDQIELSFDLIGPSLGLPALSVSNDNGTQTVSADVSQTPLTEYPDWLIDHYPLSSNASVSRTLYFDGDRDNLPNFAEYLLSTNPGNHTQVLGLFQFVEELDGRITAELEARSEFEKFQFFFEQIQLNGDSEPLTVTGTKEDASETDMATYRYDLGTTDQYFFRLRFAPYPPAE